MFTDLTLQALYLITLLLLTSPSVLHSVYIYRKVDRIIKRKSFLVLQPSIIHCDSLMVMHMWLIRFD